MRLRDLIRIACSVTLWGGSVYIFGLDLLRHYWPMLSITEAYALTNPLVVIAGIAGACFIVSPLAPRLSDWWELGCRQFQLRRW